MIEVSSSISFWIYCSRGMVETKTFSCDWALFWNAPPSFLDSVAGVNTHHGVTVIAYAVRVAAFRAESTGLAFFVGQTLPFMDAGSVDGVGIDVAPTVALSARGIEVGITPVAGIGVVREMEGSMPLAHGALHREVTNRIATSHVLKRTGIGMTPVVAHRVSSLFLKPVYQMRCEK